MQREYVFERNSRTFKCRVYEGALNQLCVDIFEKVKFFSTTCWKRKREYNVYREYRTAYDLAKAHWKYSWTKRTKKPNSKKE